MKIALFCSGGMSTSLVGAKMKKAYETMGKTNVDVDAYDFAMIDEVGNEVDVIIIAPQISWAFEQVKAAHPDKKIISLTMAEFGAMDGVSIINRLNDEGVIPE
ncbi:PTS sugar transporter subunit IIB [Listeria ivanovii]|uniref:PTS sugar transporter subunit IIB n=1 Tax=Listeria ivanovii TaxID=1638 RepID=UPI00194176BD|nr:transcription antiterminator [Listeria ivanovii]MBM5607654.1 transcription antiterminator [Listeria ivanovii]MBM5635985.1 transcription antiterminator [Listeria ivanovii]MBM5705515.1 transcription antiterminator [Listeria ivanovii]